MWLFFQIVAYLALAFAIGAGGAWILRGRMAEDSLEHLRQRFRQMVSSSEMERDAARLRVRELARRVEELEARLEGRPADGSSTAEAEVFPVSLPESETAPSEAAANGTDAGVSKGSMDRVATAERGTSDPAESSGGEPVIGAPSEYGSVRFAPDRDDGGATAGSGRWGRFEEEPVPDPAPGGDEVEDREETPEPSMARAPDEGEDAPPEAEAVDPAGGGHPLSHLGEVPPEAATALRSMGLHDTTALHRHFQNGYDPAAMARELDIEPRRVRRWRILAELLEVPGLVPESAWLLEISGVASLSELAAEDPGELADRMTGINRDQGLGLPAPTQDQVASWVLWASQAGAIQV